MEVDRKFLDMLTHVRPEERAALMNLLEINRNDPNTAIIIAIFRDVYMFREMSQALLMRYQANIRELEARVEELESKLGAEDE